MYNNSPLLIKSLNRPVFEKYGLKCSVVRLDKVSEIAPGNKLFKLSYNLQQAIYSKAGAIVSFGGPWSNHLHALALSGQKYNIPTVAFVRGYQDMPLTPMLEDVSLAGMQIIFVNRSTYKKRKISDFLPILKSKYGNLFVVPEGGSNFSGVRGCIDLGKQLKKVFEKDNATLCLPVGTGATMAGLVIGANSAIKVLGFSVLKGKDTLSTKIQNWLSQFGSAENQNSWSLATNYHQGGYAKVSANFLDWLLDFEKHAKFQIDPVYTGKMFWGIEDLASKGYWAQGSHIVALHTGGVQGRRGFINDGFCNG